MPYTLHFDVYATNKAGQKLDILNSTESIKERKPAAYHFTGELPQEIDEGFLGHILNELIATLNGDYGVGFPLLGKCEDCGQWVDEIHLGHPQVPIYSPEGELLDLREQDICVECLKKGGQ
ncbi:unnamed protein product [marine sediment metagenome]|uniref:Uncharacterized protein n=1 Tax=marine sediment metagenome TaxID=412755 RepID=X1QJP9_9ZZZZ